MKTMRQLMWLLFIVWLFGHCTYARQPASSPRNANYTIQVRLDPATKILEGREVITWRNIQDTPAHELWFHLYYNAWQNEKSTWFREWQLSVPNTSEQAKPQYFGSCNLISMRIINQNGGVEEDLIEHVRRVPVDDGNPDDATVVAVPISRPVLPGRTITLEVGWVSRIPHTFATTGYRGTFFFLAYWYPKLGVYEKRGTWNCHQFHAHTEFFSDYGIYDVFITVPNLWKVGATGGEITVTSNPDGTATHHYFQTDVHDFAWTTSPSFKVVEQVINGSESGAIRLRLLYQAEHGSQVQRYLAAARASLKYFESWYGRYPYGHLTIVDPPFRSHARGMEFPTLVTGGTSYLDPPRSSDPERVVIHEIGHQFVYGLVGNNEFEDAWIDEGFTTYSGDRIVDLLYPNRPLELRFFHGFLPITIRGMGVDEFTEWDKPIEYAKHAHNEVLETPTYEQYPPTAGVYSYFKPSLWLLTLERTLGWQTMRSFLRSMFNKWQFKHPTPYDVRDTLNEASGKDLTFWFDQFYRTSAVFDFSVESASSVQVNQRLLPSAKVDEAIGKSLTASPRLFETRVTVRRLQDGIMPVEVLLKFENGEELRDVWDAKASWKVYRLVKPSRLEYAVVDPEHKIVLDVNYTNNSFIVNPQGGLPSTKWASKWMIWLQDYFATLSWFS